MDPNKIFGMDEFRAKRDRGRNPNRSREALEIEGEARNEGEAREQNRGTE